MLPLSEAENSKGENDMTLELTDGEHEQALIALMDRMQKLIEGDRHSSQAWEDTAKASSTIAKRKALTEAEVAQTRIALFDRILKLMDAERTEGPSWDLTVSADVKLGRSEQ